LIFSEICGVSPGQPIGGPLQKGHRP
jgi:hypothetical protein